MVELGCQVWSFRSLQEGAPWDDEIRKIARLGFKGIELILCTSEELDTYWKHKTVQQVRDLYQSLGLKLTQFAIFQPAVSHLVDLNDKLRQQSIDVYKRGCDLAIQLGASIVNFVAQWPLEIKAPKEYIPRYYYVDAVGAEPKLKMEIPRGFNWDKYWNTYVQTMKECTKIARERNLKLAVEGHINVMMPHTDSFLRLSDHVNDPAFGYCMDIGWQALQREYIPWSIYKVRGRLFTIHLRDVDGFGLNFVCPGMGMLDWESILEALQDIGYNGYLSLEFSEYDMKLRENYAKFVVDYFTPLLNKINGK